MIVETMPSVNPHLINIAPLARLAGAKLQNVQYWCLKHEAIQEDIGHPHFFLGGVVKLMLDNQPLYLSWEKEARRPITSSLTVSEHCTWQDDYYCALDASDTPYWQPLIGRSLIQVDLMGWRSIASVAALSFGDNIMYVGTGSQLEYGYGDDILIRSQETFWQSPHVQNLEILHSVRAKTYSRRVLVA